MSVTMARRIMGGLGLALALLLGLIALRPVVQAAPASSAQLTAPAPRAPAKLQPAALTSAPAADQSYQIKSVLELDGPLSHGSFAWNDAGVPAGELLITVDLAAETISVFRAGYEIGAAAILYGAYDKPTPLGRFAITQKKAKHISTIYNAPMPFMLRLTDDGVAIHGSSVDYGSATHGCIGVPLEFAELLFAQANLGDRVIITRGERLAVGAKLPAA